LFTWTALVASILIVFGFPPLTVGLFLLTFDRMFGSNFFIVEAGGNTIIWEHLFWIFGHPEVYILIRSEEHTSELQSRFDLVCRLHLSSTLFPYTTLFRSLFTWTALVASILIVFGFPPLTVGLFLLTFDRMFGSNFFIVEAGGNTIIWEHLFWIFGHPEVYILI